MFPQSDGTIVQNKRLYSAYKLVQSNKYETLTGRILSTLPTAISILAVVSSLRSKNSQTTQQ